MTLTEFLLARIAEDEAAAMTVRPNEHLSIRDESRLRAGYDRGHEYVSTTSGRILAECAAKRVAVQWYLNDDDQVMGATVEAMAAVYADHRDYDESWRP